MYLVTALSSVYAVCLIVDSSFFTDFYGVFGFDLLKRSITSPYLVKLVRIGYVAFFLDDLFFLAFFSFYNWAIYFL